MNPSAFTTSFAERRLRLINTVICEQNGQSISVSAKWDTGASSSCVSSQLVEALGLEPTGYLNVITPSGIGELPTYILSLVLPNGIRLEDIRVCGSAIGNEGIHVLIGMDVITLGDFATSCKDGKTKFTFRIPSVKDADYVNDQLNPNQWSHFNVIVESQRPPMRVAFCIRKLLMTVVLT